MWRDYSSGFIKNNRASSISIIAGAFIAALFLSLVCSLLYNNWAYETEQVILDEGSWQARITGPLNEADLADLQNFASVEQVILNGDLSTEYQTTVDLTFHNTRTIFEDMPLITEALELPRDAVQYNLLLLSRYMIHDPAAPQPPMLVAFSLVIMLVVSFSMILIIHNSFAVSMNARVYQFGIFSSIGATPAQIRACLMQEAAALCVIPILAGIGIGVGLSYAALEAVNLFAGGAAGRRDALFQYHPLIFAATLFISALTVLFSAWIPAGKLSKMAPLQAIRNTGELGLKKGTHSRILKLLFGIEGELADNALKAQKKAMRTSTLSLTLSFLGFTLMLCFFTLSGISTEYTYFARYQDAWDVMITVKDTGIADFPFTDEFQGMPGVESCVVYQKASSRVLLPAGWQSDPLTALGGLPAVAGDSVADDGSAAVGSSASAAGNVFTVQAPLVILDDDSFLAYCESSGVTPGLDGSILLNRIWDSVNSNFRYKDYIPYVDESVKVITLQNAADPSKKAEIPVLGFAQEPPALREEYDNYALVQFLPLSLWNRIFGQLWDTKADTYVRVLAPKGSDAESLSDLESRLTQLMGPAYETESENRILEKIWDDNMKLGAMIIWGSFCALLALIGIANVFSNTLGFLRQRRREFAQYMSVGMTIEDMKKMFCIEALVIAGRPLVITLPVTVVSTGCLIQASYLNPMEFIVKAPILPILAFILAIFGFVALAYCIGGRRVLRCSLAEALRDDGLM